MKKTIAICAVLTLMMVAGTANALTWNFTNTADYKVDGDPSLLPVITASSSGGSAYFAPRPYNSSDPVDVAYGSDWASVFARINTQAPGLAVGDITGGGFTVSGMNNPDAVYGSLYLSPTGLAGSTVMINMSPMGQTGSGGALVYTFDLNTPANVKILNGADGSWGTALTTGTFGGAIDWVNNNAPYSSTYAAFFGPQISLNGFSGTTFTVSQIELSTVPEPVTMLSVFGAVAGIGAYVRRRMAA